MIIKKKKIHRVEEWLKMGEDLGTLTIEMVKFAFGFSTYIPVVGQCPPCPPCIHLTSFM